MSVVRVAFPLIASQAWMGGYNYLLSLITALKKHESSRIEPVLFCGLDAMQKDLDAFEKIDGLQIVQHQAFSANTQTMGLLQALFLGKNLSVTTLFSKTNIDLIFEPAKFYGWRLKQQGIAWFPDFQHRKMPNLFSRMSWLKREIGFQMQIWSGRTISLSSDDAKQDCEEFYGERKNPTGVLKFPMVISEHLLKVDFSTFKTQYDLPEKFVYVPNQFWLHKNHEVLIEALGLLKKNDKKLTIICTGNTKDPRSLDHFSMLEDRIAKLGLIDDFRILGLIPREHALGLLRTCTLMVNPSFFEGWNTSVEEAKAFNTPMLLSNITVHQEQAGNKVRYFNPNDADSLAVLLDEEVQRLSSPDTARMLEQHTDKAAESFASAFTDLVLLSFKG